MAKLAPAPGSKSRIITFYITKLSDGSNLESVVFGDVTCYYTIEGATPVAVTLVTATPGTYTNSGGAGTGGGFIQRATVKAQYELSAPDAAWASGKSVIFQLFPNGGASSVGMAINNAEFDEAASSIVQYAIHKNVAFANFPFDMVLSSDHVTPYNGAANTVTSKVSLDAGNFNACTNSGAATTITGGPNGKFRQNLSAADLNGNAVMLVFSAPTCDDTVIKFATQN